MATAPIVQRYDTTPYPEKWRAFGWAVLEIDGHDMGAILGALDAAEATRGVPTMIIARTVKGAGVSFAEHRPEFHNGSLTTEQFERACRELADPAATTPAGQRGGGA
jgi:transketolase